jgi:SPP1 gp7 family putative phage head morphogenesis protein
MIGRAATGGIKAGNSPPSYKERADRVREVFDNTWDHAVEILEPVFRFVSRVVRIARWVLERVAVIYPIRWYQWQTANDERTCPECGSMQGRTWHEQQAIPTPPLHVNCRCRVTHAWTEWRVRYVPSWRLRWFTRREWEWTRTGWA